MAWKGGFTGRGYTRQEFRDWLHAQTKPAWVKFLVAHNTAAPYIRPPVAPSIRVNNLGAYYKKLGWSTGPNLITILDRIYPGTPLAFPGTNSPGYNGKGLGIEVEGDYRTGVHDPKSGDGATAWNTASWGFAELLDWLGFPLDDAHIKLHREDPQTTHQCPGNLVTKPWLMGKIADAAVKKPDVPPPPPKDPDTPPYDTRTIQERLKVHGFDPGPIDGIPGPKTLAAIKAFQSFLRVSPTGIIGPWAWMQLKKDPPAKPAVITPPDQVLPVETILPPGAPELNPAKAMRLLTTAPILWPRHWAAAAVAQAQRESYPDLRPWAQGDWFIDDVPSKKGTPGAEPTAFTIWQLRGARWKAYNDWAKAQNKNWDDFETQVLWCPHELKTSEKLAWKWLQKSMTVEQANAAMVWFERPKGYIASNAKAATTWDEVFSVSTKCDGYDVRLKFAKALM